MVNDATGRTAQAVSDAQGTYRAPALAPAATALESTLDGFEPAARQVAIWAGQTAAVDVVLKPSRLTESVVVTARRVEEVAQEVPIPLSVVDGKLAAATGAFNVNRLKELIPTVQFYSTNPRNSAINIRGLGAPFGLTNDGLEPGVGLYIDGVFYARPAAATLDFLDVERIEVLRGPQGTLFGKNTTAGAINVTTRKPSFTRGDRRRAQLRRPAVSCRPRPRPPARSARRSRAALSFSGTSATARSTTCAPDRTVNDLDNLGLRGQLLFAPSDRLAITGRRTTTAGSGRTATRRSSPASRRRCARPTGSTRRLPPTSATPPPSFNAFDRLTDVDTPLRSYQDLGGASVNVDWKIGRGQLTSTSAWRYWNWNPSNDRDFIGLPVTTMSAAPSRQRQLTQEVRYAGDLSPRREPRPRRVRLPPDHRLRPGVPAGTGLRGRAFPARAERERGDAWPARWLRLQPVPRLRRTPARRCSASSPGRSPTGCGLLPGIRFNYDHKDVDFDQQVYGGLQTTNPALIALQQSILAPQAYQANVSDANTSGQLTVGYKLASTRQRLRDLCHRLQVGRPEPQWRADRRGEPARAVGRDGQAGRHPPLRSRPEDRAAARRDRERRRVYDTEIKNFQAQVTNGSVGVIRGYLANAEKVRVRGAEFDGSARLARNISLYGAVAYTDGKYVRFVDAPPALEDTGGPQFEDISGSRDLPGMSRRALSLGGEYGRRVTLAGRAGQLFGALDTSYRSCVLVERHPVALPGGRRLLRC